MHESGNIFLVNDDTAWKERDHEKVRDDDCAAREETETFQEGGFRRYVGVESCSGCQRCHQHGTCGVS